MVLGQWGHDLGMTDNEGGIDSSLLDTRQSQRYTSSRKRGFVLLFADELVDHPGIGAGF